MPYLNSFVTSSSSCHTVITMSNTCSNLTTKCFRTVSMDNQVYFELGFVNGSYSIIFLVTLKGVCPPEKTGNLKTCSKSTKNTREVYKNTWILQ